MNKPNAGSRNKPLPLPVILTAISGDADAIRDVLKHYEGYIFTLSVKRLKDEDGNTYFFADEELRHELETRLITKILTFKPRTA